ncbi:MAG: hypothetical protein RTV72_04055 [Candidatus Thorarchaeota archaeon]
MNDEAWYPCVYELSKPPANVRMSGPLITNVDESDNQIILRLPVPLRKGHLKLHVTGVQIGLYGADSANYVSQISVNGMTHLAMKVMFEAKDAINAQQLKTYTFAPHDCSGYEAVLARVWCAISAPSKLHIASVSMKCYYA